MSPTSSAGWLALAADVRQRRRSEWSASFNLKKVLKDWRRRPFISVMNNATTRIAQICNPASLLNMLLSGASFPAQTELASTGPACSGNGETPSTYLAPEKIEWFYTGPTYEGFQAPVTYTRRCK
jgi:hypothetical protein